MHITYTILLLITHFGILAHCKAGTAALAGAASGYISGRILSCGRIECVEAFGIAFGIFAGVIIVVVLVICGVKCCCKHCKDRRRRRSSPPVRPSRSNDEQSESNAFRSGIWSSWYSQDGQWHGPHEFSLSFDPQSMKVTGFGSDSMGTFTIDGDYSTETHRIGLTKHYREDASSSSENFEHQVILQLTWNAQKNQFEGEWYMQGNEYHGHNKFKLKFKREQPLTV